MSNVLFLSNIALDNPRRGTPIHVERLLRELRKDHSLLVCAASVTPELRDIFVPYPIERGFGKLRSLLRLVDQYQSKTILTIGQTGLLAPVMLKLLRRVRIVVELQGVEFEEKFAVGHIGWLGFYVWKFKTLLELHFYDVVFAFSKRAAQSYGRMSRTWRIVYGGIDLNDVPHVDRYEKKQVFTIGYMGNTRAYQGLPYLLEAASEVRKKGLPVRLHFVLSGDDAEVRKLVAQLKLDDITAILKDLPQQEARREVLKVDVLVIPRPNVPEAIFGFPSKLPEYLATGLPVILTDIGPVEELRPEIEAHCLIVEASNSHSIADAVERVAHMSDEEILRRGKAARAYAQKFNWTVVTASISAVL